MDLVEVVLNARLSEANSDGSMGLTWCPCVTWCWVPWSTQTSITFSKRMWIGRLRAFRLGPLPHGLLSSARLVPGG